MNEELKKLDPNLCDTSNTLTNFSNSILAHFGVKPFHSTIKEVDEALLGHKKVAVFLFDGASEYNLKIYPRTNKFLLDHKLKTIYSVNPATTVACTTAFLSAKFPIETGWLGWSLDFHAINLPIIDTFTGKESYGRIRHEPSPMLSYSPYKNIATLLSEHGVKAKQMYQYPVEDKKGPKNHKEALKMYSSFFKEEGGEFLYGYFSEPDHTLHNHGVKSVRTYLQYKKMNKFLKKFVKANPDVLVFAFADHGLINIDHYDDISDFRDIESTLARPVSIDTRIPTFFVKEGKKEEFVAAFNRHFGSDFLLVSKEDILESKYFGDGEPSKEALSFLGDYLGISLRNVGMKEYYGQKETPLKAHHSGASKEEREVLLSVYNL